MPAPEVEAGLRRRRRRLRGAGVMLAALLATILVVGRVQRGPHLGQAELAPPAPPAGKQMNNFSGSYTNAAGMRSFLGYTPSSYRAGSPLPLVVALHGCTQTADDLRKLTRFNDMAEVDHFIVVYPEQSRDANDFNCWNWFNAADRQRGSGEPSLIAGVTGWVQQRYSVDPKRIFVTGFSAGGAMTAVMGATYPDLYAAIGIGSGIQFGGSFLDPVQAGGEAFRAMGPYARVVPAVIFQGDGDQIVPVANADKLVRQWLTTDDWADDGSVNGSVPYSPTGTRDGRVPGGRSYTVTDYVDSHGRDLVQHWLVRGMGHAWSGGCSCAAYADPAGPDETRTVYDFFLSHSMP
jgi:poly(hydroxyalkanoate) depolymerase family esterase